MMMRFIKSWPALALVAVFAATGSAQADFKVQFTDVGMGITTGPIAVTDGGTIGIVVGNFKISGVTTITNNPGDSTSAWISINNAAVTNTSGSTGTLMAMESANDFSAPTGPSLFLDSNANGLVASGLLLGDSVLTPSHFTSYVNSDNALFSTVGAVASPVISFNATGSGFGFGQLVPVSSNGFALGGNYSITNVGYYTLSAGTRVTGTLGYSAVIVPEPASMVMAGIGSCIVLFGSVVRRRRNASVAV
jgi:PEP-CTERM motif